MRTEIADAMLSFALMSSESGALTASLSEKEETCLFSRVFEKYYILVMLSCFSVYLQFYDFL